MCGKIQNDMNLKKSRLWNLKHDFNFLAVSQISPRKNFDNMVKWFVEEFIDQEVGLVIKTNIASNAKMDFEHLEKRMKQDA